MELNGVTQGGASDIKPGDQKFLVCGILRMKSERARDRESGRERGGG